MKTKFFFAATLLLLCLAGCTPKKSDTKKSDTKGVFSVSANRQVRFSQGNLQYQASTGTWRFAEHQWDVVGIGYGQMDTYTFCSIGGTVKNSDNRNICSTYNGWIDLFCWGTGNKPTNTRDNNSDYSVFTDWGVNAISNGGNAANQWRTLTAGEWGYLFYDRTNATNLFGWGSVNGVNGIIILPDKWVTPQGASFTPGATLRLVDHGSFYTNDNDDKFSVNTYTAEQWSIMEQSGAVFLPAAGLRFGTNLIYVGLNGSYWSSTPDDRIDAFFLRFGPNDLGPQDINFRNSGYSVRLVH